MVIAWANRVQEGFLGVLSITILYMHTDHRQINTRQQTQDDIA